MEIKSFLRNKDVLNQVRNLGYRFTISNLLDEIGLNFSLETHDYRNKYYDPSINVQLRYIIDKPFALFTGFSDIQFNIYNSDGFTSEDEINLTEIFTKAFVKNVHPNVDFYQEGKFNIKHGQWYHFETYSNDEQSVVLTGDSMSHSDNELSFSLRFIEEYSFAEDDKFLKYLSSIFIAIHQGIVEVNKESKNVL
tara:strand:- start:4873 stop:5454 length:582 start_codon:yes stop_codon:yes gene_type:complete